MTLKPLRLFAVLAAACVLPMGCATNRGGPEGGQAVPAVTKLVKSAQSWTGDVMPAYPQGQPEITILRIRIPPGARLETHHHPVINAGVLLSGQLTVIAADGKTLHLKAGDPIVEVVNTPHYGVNEGKVPAEIVVFYAGVLDKPITVIEPH